MDTSFTNDLKGKRILFCVLNWGLGHASRSIPLIKHLKEENIISIASDGEAGILLQKEMPSLSYTELPAYDVNYRYNSMRLNMLLQLPKIASRYLRERKKVNEIVSKIKPDLIISDHRYGCRHPHVKSVFLGHQLNILGSGAGTRLNKNLISKFDECWVPDHEDRPLSGKLSSPDTLKNVKFIGPLSRMQKLILPKQYDISVVLSGPEPNRTELESDILRQLEMLDVKACVVRGTLDGPVLQSKHEIKNLVDSKELNQILCSSEMIVCRSGYSSLMDLEVLDKPALIIPTIGQREQEYLARNFAKKKHIVTQHPKTLDLAEARGALMT